jgi:hypothetical protein
MILERVLSTTNAIENLIGAVRDLGRRVKRWRDARMIVRWTVTAVADAVTRFRQNRWRTRRHGEAGDCASGSRRRTDAGNGNERVMIRGRMRSHRMLLKLEPKARELADYMSGLSEEAYCAGWMDGLEFELWEAVISGPRKYGRLQITLNHTSRLRRLSEAAGGWIIFDETEEELLLPMGEWKRRFNEWKQDAQQGRR